MNGKFVIFFDIDENVWIYSVYEEMFEKSDVETPEVIRQAVTVSNKQRNEFTISGFARRIWTLSGMDCHLFPPQYLIGIICAYYLNEFIHVFVESAYNSAKHWKISVFDIIK